MKIIFICVAVLLTGCGVMSTATEKTFNAMPSAKHCTDISYVRKNRDITVEAKCVAPVENASTVGIPGL